MYSTGTRPSFSNTSVTSHMPKGPRESEPAKMTSSILPPRRCFADCSPMHQRIASTMFDLPQPFGPTTEVMGWLNCSTVRSQNDLNPEISSRLIFIHQPRGEECPVRMYSAVKIDARTMY